MNEQQKLALHLHLAQCEECRRRSFVWFHKRHGLKVPVNVKDPLLARLRQRMSWDRPR